MAESPQRGRREWDQRYKWREDSEHLHLPLREQKGEIVG